MFFFQIQWTMYSIILIFDENFSYNDVFSSVDHYLCWQRRRLSIFTRCLIKKGTINTDNKIINSSLEFFCQVTALDTTVGNWIFGDSVEVKNTCNEKRVVPNDWVAERAYKFEFRTIISSWHRTLCLNVASLTFLVYDKSQFSTRCNGIGDHN